MNRLFYFLFVLLILAVLAPSSGYANEYPFAPYLECYQALDKKAGSHFVLFRGSRVGSYGLYVATHSHVFYQPLPLGVSHKDKKIHHYSVQLPGIPVVYLEYTDDFPIKTTQRWSYYPSPGVAYIAFNTIDRIPLKDTQFRQALHLDLNGRIQRVMSAYKKDDRNGTLRRTPIRRVRYYQAIKTCADRLKTRVEHASLLATVNFAMQTFRRPNSTTVQAGAGFPVPSFGQ